MNKISVNQLEIGKSYNVVTEFWQLNNVIYYGTEIIRNRINYCFTAGTIDNHHKQFNIKSPKSKLKIFEAR